MDLHRVVRFLRNAVDGERRSKALVDSGLLLARDAGLSLSELAEVMGITKSAVAQRLDVLERKDSADAR